MNNIPMKIWVCYLNAMYLEQRWLHCNRRPSALPPSHRLDLQLKYHTVSLENMNSIADWKDFD